MSTELWDEVGSAVPVMPKDCAIGIALPLTHADVLRHLAEPSRFGYVPGIVKNRAVSPALIDALWKIYSEQVVMPVELLCKKLAQMNVEVYLGVDLCTIPQMMLKRRVVLLWTHWEATDIKAEEITDTEEFIRLAESGSTWVRREVLEGLRPRHFWGFWKGNLRGAVERAKADGQLGSFIASALNRLIRWARSARDESFRRALRNGAMPVGPTSAPLVTRVLIERDFHSAIRVGRCVETSEGMVPAWHLLKHVPNDHSCVLDLTICNSTEFAELARIERPHVRVIGHAHKADVVSGALLVGRTFDLLASQPQSYLRARAQAVQELRDKLWRQK